MNDFRKWIITHQRSSPESDSLSFPCLLFPFFVILVPFSSYVLALITPDLISLLERTTVLNSSVFPKSSKPTTLSTATPSIKQMIVGKT